MNAGQSQPSVPAEGFSYQLRIGVVGHRKLADVTAVRRAVDRVLDHFSETLQPQSRTAISWTVVSPLARGADRIVAESVLQRRPSSLAVVLPFSVDEYRRDFEAGEDADQFEELFQQASIVENVTKVDRPPGDDDAARARSRNRCYLATGRSVIDRSEVAIFVWNGRPAKALGGTGDVVRYALQLGRTAIWIHAEDPDRPACLIHHWGQGEEPETQELPRTPKSLSGGYHRLNAYNADTTISPDKIRASVAKATESFRGAATRAGLDSKVVNPVVATVIPSLARADALAVYYQKKYVASVKSLFWLSAFAVSVAAGQSLFFPGRLWLILFEILAMGLAVWLWRHCKRQAWHEKWIHDRFLAERLRTVGIHWLLRGEVRSVPDDAKLPFYAGPGDWTASVLNQLAKSVGSEPRTVPDFAAAKRLVINEWLDDQRRYHAGNTVKKQRAAHRGHRIGNTLFLLTLLMAILHVVGVGHVDHHTADHAYAVAYVLRVDVWITFFTIILPVWGAAMHAITNQLETERIAARSKSMAVLLGVFVEQSGATESMAELEAIIEDADRVMSAENHEWWTLMSFRPPVLPV